MPATSKSHGSVDKVVADAVGNVLGIDPKQIATEAMKSVLTNATGGGNGGTVGPARPINPMDVMNQVLNLKNTQFTMGYLDSLIADQEKKAKEQNGTTNVGISTASALPDFNTPQMLEFIKTASDDQIGQLNKMMMLKSGNPMALVMLGLMDGKKKDDGGGIMQQLLPLLFQQMMNMQKPAENSQLSMLEMIKVLKEIIVPPQNNNDATIQLLLKMQENNNTETRRLERESFVQQIAGLKEQIQGAGDPLSNTAETLEKISNIKNFLGTQTPEMMGFELQKLALNNTMMKERREEERGDKSMDMWGGLINGVVNMVGDKLGEPLGQAARNLITNQMNAQPPMGIPGMNMGMPNYNPIPQNPSMNVPFPMPPPAQYPNPGMMPQMNPSGVPPNMNMPLPKMIDPRIKGLNISGMED